MDPIIDDDVPEGLIQNDDGSVTIPEEAAEPKAGTEFLENLATIIPQSKLTSLGSEYCELLTKDHDARKKRDELYAEGIRRTGLGDEAPGGASFNGASKVVHPVMAESCVDFAARAMKELFPPQGPVKTKIIGPANTQTLDKADRKKQYMNWQLTQQIPEFRSELEQTLTQLPLGGSQFLKIWRDNRMKRTTCEFVPIDDIRLPFSATSFYSTPRKAHVLHLTDLEFRRRVKSGLYIDLSIGKESTPPDQSEAAQATNAVEGKDEDAYNEDGLRDLYEIYCWLEIDDPLSDDVAPYIMTVDVHTEKVLSLYRNWDEEDATQQELDWIIEYKFIPWRGAYAIGLPHLIGGLAAGLTGSLRALLDSAHINNAPSAVKLKGGRTPGQDVNVEITQITEIPAPPGVQSIRDVIMPLPFNPPSPVLFQLLGFLTDAAKGVVATADERIGQVGDRTPVGTTMALIEQGSTTYSSIHARLHESQARALAIIHRLNRQYLDDEQVIAELGDMVVRREDFTGPMNIQPVSDPAIFSEAQRFAQAQSLIQMSQDPSVPWNKHQIYRRVLKQMRIEGPDEVLPPPVEPYTGNVIAENALSSQGRPIKADPRQEHMAHIEGHLDCIEFNLLNPLSNAQNLMALLNHVGEHIQMYEHTLAEQMMQQVAAQFMESGQQPSPETVAAMAQKQAFQQLAQQMPQIVGRITQLQPQLQQKMPPPQMPPEVQASLQIAQMENQRKTQYDQASLQAQQAKEQAQQALDAARFQGEQQAMLAEESRENQRMFMDRMTQQFEHQLALMAQRAEDQANQMAQQVELLKNKEDNQQHQITELLKNRDDNQTQLLIEQVKGAINEQQQSQLTPLVEQLQTSLDMISDEKTQSALDKVLAQLKSWVKTPSK